MALKNKILKLLGKNMPGNAIRVWLFRRCGYEIGEQVYIGEDLIIIDDLEGSQTKLSIGDRASISPRVTFVLHSAPNSSRIRPYVNERIGTVTVGKDAWIGAGAVILPNVEIGEGAVVGSASVVTKNVSPYTVVGGVPARVIKTVDVPWRS
jgi:acetyltransferase-like isoleucine patch superfamily enzyme